jgi:hypothetical protein
MSGPITKKFVVESYSTFFYCKINTYINKDNIISANFIFGKKDICYLSITIDNIEDQTGKINVMDYYESCILNGSLDYGEEMYQYIQTALYTFHTQFPNIEKLTFTDNNHIHFTINASNKQYTEYTDSMFKNIDYICEVKLADDCIFKHIQTYYEKYFGARLPEEEYTKYRISINDIDLPHCVPFICMNDLIYGFEKYKEIYESSSTPREFIRNLREKYGEKYCYEVGPWFHKYIRMLHLYIPNYDWYIEPNNIECPKKYNIFSTDSCDITYDIFKVRENDFYVISSMGNGTCLGFYEDFMSDDE